MLGFENRLQEMLFGPVVADWLAPVGVLIAIAVSVHVLLHKRDVGTAMGWMGLAWISPFAGGLLYAVFGVNRVSRRARVRRQNIGARPRRSAGAGPPAPNSHLAPLARATTRITERPLVGGNEMQVLRCGDEAYPEMVGAIAAAKRSVALASYILRDDAAGGAFIDALIEAHRRGVQVRVLLDGIGGG